MAVLLWAVSDPRRYYTARIIEKKEILCHNYPLRSGSN